MQTIRLRKPKKIEGELFRPNEDFLADQAAILKIPPYKLL